MPCFRPSLAPRACGDLRGGRVGLLLPAPAVTPQPLERAAPLLALFVAASAP